MPRAKARSRSLPAPAATEASMVTPRAVDRLLRALSRAGGRGERNGEGRARATIEAAGIRRSLHFAEAVVAEAASLGLVRITGESVALTEAATARLRRDALPSHPFLAQHAPLLPMPGPLPAGAGGGAPLVNEAESPLAWLRRRRGPDGRPLLDDDAFQAGERLRMDFTRASLMPRTTTNWDAVAAPSRGTAAMRLDPSDVAVAARQRVRRALDAVGPGLSGLLVDVCCFLKGLEQVEKERAWPARSAKVVLLIALERLAAHYARPPAAGPRDGARLRRWAAPDARPAGRPGR